MNIIKLKNDSHRGLENNNLKTKTVQGFKWSFVNQVGNQILNLSFSIYLARLLSPTEYGLIAMITVFTGFGAVFIDFGLGNALIYKDNPSNKDWSTVLWTNLIFGLILMFVFYGLSVQIALFYKEPSLQYLTQTLSVVFVLSALSLVPKAKLRRSLNFKSIALSNIIAIVFSGVIGLYFASNGYGVWSLVFQRIAFSSCLMINYFAAVAWLPRLHFSIDSLRSIFSYSIYQFATGFIGYWSRNLDNLMIGRFVSTEELGVYSRAYSFLMLPINTISKLLTAVMMPSISRIKDDQVKVRLNFIKIARLLCFVVSPIMACLFLAANEITLLVFGPKWLGIVPFLKLFSLLGVYQSIISLNGPLYYALGKTKLDFKINLFTQSVNLIGILIGVQWGAKGMVAGIYISSLINFYPVNYFILKSIDLSVLKYYRELLFIFLINVFVTFLILLAYPYLNFGYKLNLLCILFSYFTIYILASKLTKLNEVQMCINILKSRGRNYE